MPREIVREYLSADTGLEGGPAPERPLAGKTAIVTGASRDVGRGIATALAREGVRIVGNHRDPGKAKRATAVEQEIADFKGDITFETADITTDDGRKNLFGAFRAKSGKEVFLDMLILNASGPTREVNVDGNNGLVDAFLPIMRKGGKIVLMQSVPGHWFDQLDPNTIPEFYRSVAAAKFEGEESLKRRIPEFDEKGVSFFVVCPPAVVDSTNMKFFSRLDPQALAKHSAISESLDLPHEITIGQVGQKVVSLLKSNVPQGYLELFRE